MTPLEQDRESAHHFAIGAMHVAGKHSFTESEHQDRYALATGFAYFYTRDGHMALGIDGAWDAYVQALREVSKR